jgi:N-acetylglucosaminyl-diphospho-decaprenol L-rhamnosyltransferase
MADGAAVLNGRDHAAVDTAEPPCAAVVVHYRDAASTQRCVGSLLAQQPQPHVVVVDNAAPDGSGRLLAEALAAQPGTELVVAARNGGFGAGCNLGIARALQRWPRLEHVLLLNPDAELAPHALAELRTAARRHPQAGIVGCPIDAGDGTVWFDNGRIPRWTLSRFHTRARREVEHRVGFVTGACMLLRGDLLRAGLRFDERYFLYCEDADLCEQVRALGNELWLTRRARAVHRAGGSQPGTPVLGELTGERLYWLTRAKMLFAARRLNGLQRCCALLLAVFAKPLAAVLCTRSTRWLAPYWRGVRDGLRAARDARHAPAKGDAGG